VFSNNTRLCVAVVAIAFIVGAVIFIGTFVLSRHDAVQVAGNTETTIARPVFTITEIEGIENVFSAVRAGSSASLAPVDVRSAVLPHHTVPATKLMELWTRIAAGSHPSVIVIVGPNHENAGEGLVQTTHGVWTSPFGSVETDDGLVDRLVSLGTATDELDSFVNEHAIGTHVSYVADLFPGVPIVPIIAKSPAGYDDAASFVLVLRQLLPDDALVVSSIDFCHFLPQDRTDVMDDETLALIASRRYDQIERLHSDHVDTPFALIAYLLWNDGNGDAADLEWHDSSHRLLGDPNAPGTSYLVYFSTRRGAGTPPIAAWSGAGTPRIVAWLGAGTPPLELSFVGDVMLGRAVATAMAKTTVEQAFGSAAGALAGSDLAFANLESVFTSSTTPSGKSIFFKADPARTDVLAYLGITHVSVTNNHVDDYGRVGWDQSVETLKASGIVPVGDYGNNPEPIVTEIQGKRVVFLAYDDLYHPISATRLTDEVTAADKLGDMLIVSFHWGVEYQHNPIQRQKDLAHAAIDAGADLIVGHHPHVLEGIETYGNGLILYSLGNFIFDQVGEDENESVVANIRLDENGTRTLTLIPMRIEGRFPRLATDEERDSTLERIAQWSSDGSNDIAASIQEGVVTW
jgi:poly-gamma-glutamate synthesis protein (capsule biosynthesis protein)